MSIIRIGLSEKKFADGYDAIFGKKKASQNKKAAAKRSAGKKKKGKKK